MFFKLFLYIYISVSIFSFNFNSKLIRNYPIKWQESSSGLKQSTLIIAKRRTAPPNVTVPYQKKK